MNANDACRILHQGDAIKVRVFYYRIFRRSCLFNLSRLLLILIISASSVSGQDSTASSVDRLRETLKQNPDDRRVRYDLARSYLHRHQFAEASELYKGLFREKHCTSEELKVYAVARMMEHTSKVITWRLFSKIPVIDQLQKEMPEAKQALEETLSATPDDAEARFLLAIFHKIDGDKSRAEMLLKQVIEEEPGLKPLFFEDPWIELAALYREKQRPEEASALLQKRVTLDSTDTWPMVAMALTFLDRQQDGDASGYFLRGLRHIREVQNIDKLYEEASPIATPEETATWEQLVNTDDKANFLRLFWKKRDPNPVDEINERWAEHYRRLKRARDQYPKIRPPYYDDRGYVYIRYGAPDHSYPGDRDLSWVYDEEDAFFDFVDVGGGFYELRPLTDAIPSGVMGADRLTYLHDLVAARRNLHPFYEQTASKIESQLNRTHAEASSRQLAANLAGAALQFEQSYNVRAANLRVRDRFVYDTGAPTIAINADVTSFKSFSGSRLDFSFMVPIEQLHDLPVATRDRSSFLTVRMRLLDSLYQEIQYIERTYEHTTVDSSDEGDYVILDEFRSLAAPGQYLLALDLRNNNDEKIGIYKISARVRDYSSPNLQLSDIQNASFVSEVGAADRFVKPETHLRVVPNPAGYKTRGKPLTVYYEIYNLTLDNDNKSSYEISYTIKPEGQTFFKRLFGGKKGSVSITTRKSGARVTEHEYSGFDLSALLPGKYMLRIRVKDLLSSSEVQRSIPIRLQ